MAKRLRKKKLILYFDMGQNHCPSCGKFFCFDAMTVDHIIPKSKGGTLAYSNIQLMCRKCNMIKADSMPEEVDA